MNKKSLPILLILLLYSYFGFSQATVNEKLVLPDSLHEISGIIFYNGFVYGINDSGDGPFIYVIDTTTGNIERTIYVNDAQNVDWEDIAQDENYVYVADIGNNSGNRTDLKVYKINKNDLVNDTVNAKIIDFDYHDQTDFTAAFDSNNYDAEALTILGNYLVLFTKNWVDHKTKLYLMPNVAGTCLAEKIKEYNCNGLITGATYCKDDSSFYLCGYTKYLQPFLYIISNDNPDTGIRIPIYDQTNAAQIEGICWVKGNHFLLSSEYFEYGNYVNPQKLYDLTITLNNTISAYNDNSKIMIFPNPTNHFLYLNSYDNFNSVEIYNENGRLMYFNKQHTKNIPIYVKDWSNGIYFLQATTKNGKNVVKKIIIAH